MNIEPRFIAYRVDKKLKQEFYSEEEAGQFFKCKPENIKNRAGGNLGSHLIGRNINQKWLIFLGNERTKYISEEIKNNHEDNFKWFKGRAIRRRKG